MTEKQLHLPLLLHHGAVLLFSPPWKPSSSLASQEIPHILWNWNVCYRVQKNLSLASVLNQINPVHSPPQSNFCKIHFNVTAQLCLGLTTDDFSSGFLKRNHYLFLFSMI